MAAPPVIPAVPSCRFRVLSVFGPEFQVESHFQDSLGKGGRVSLVVAAACTRLDKMGLLDLGRAVGMEN